MTKSAVIARSVSTVPDLVERSDGLWEYRGETLQDHISIWRDIDGKVESAQWALAAIAASLTTKYGESDVEEFAKSVNRSAGYIWKVARTWKFWTDRNSVPEGHFSELTFSHHVRAITHPDPVEAMHHAKANGLSAIGLEEWIGEEAKAAVDQPKKSKPKKAVKENEYKVWLERLDSSLLKDYIPSCPNKEFARRVLAREWRETIAWELREINRSENRELVLAAIEEGAHTEEDLRKVTRLSTSEVSGVVGTLVAEGLYEWVREGGETDVARGSRRAILHKVGTPVFT